MKFEYNNWIIEVLQNFLFKVKLLIKAIDSIT